MYSKNSTPSTHILKPLIKNLKDTTINKYICLRLAYMIGIDTPNVEIRWAKNIPYLLIERYDDK
ncbi:MAG: HipA domain-containing protein [Endomicrobium sp.]|nr:HipA domain-containing protein [Endomicrobium sp.]